MATTGMDFVFLPFPDWPAHIPISSGSAPNERFVGRGFSRDIAASKTRALALKLNWLLHIHITSLSQGLKPLLALAYVRAEAMTHNYTVSSRRSQSLVDRKSTR